MRSWGDLEPPLVLLRPGSVWALETRIGNPYNGVWRAFRALCYLSLGCARGAPNVVASYSRIPPRAGPVVQDQAGPGRAGAGPMAT